MVCSRLTVWRPVKKPKKEDPREFRWSPSHGGGGGWRCSEFSLVSGIRLTGECGDYSVPGTGVQDLHVSTSSRGFALTAGHAACIIYYHCNTRQLISVLVTMLSDALFIRQNPEQSPRPWPRQMGLHAL